MDIKLDKDTIERAVTDAIVQSAIGDKIKKAVQDALGKTYDNPIDKALATVVAELCMKAVRDDYYEEIKASVKTRLTDAVMEQFVGKFIDAMLKEKY